MMRVLTVQQPAAGAIVALGKVIENRTWSTTYRGLLAIHAGAKDMPEDHPFWEFKPYREALSAATSDQRHALDDHGAIIGVANLVDVHAGWLSPDRACCSSPWAETFDGSMWPVHWVLEDIRSVWPSYEFRGGLGLRHVPADVEAELLRRLE